MVNPCWPASGTKAMADRPIPHASITAPTVRTGLNHPRMCVGGSGLSKRIGDRRSGLSLRSAAPVGSAFSDQRHRVRGCPHDARVSDSHAPNC